MNLKEAREILEAKYSLCEANGGMPVAIKDRDLVNIGLMFDEARNELDWKSLNKNTFLTEALDGKHKLDYDNTAVNKLCNFLYVKAKQNNGHPDIDKKTIRLVLKYITLFEKLG